jgi:MFS family permease
MDVSSEMIHGLLPVYLTASLGASALVVGIIEGVAESTALIVKVFSGALSDRWRNRHGLAAAGYGLAAFTKPLFAMANGAGLVFFARFSEAFLVLRAFDLHLGEAYVPAVLVAMNVVYSVVAYPVGRMADRIAPRVLIFWGVAFLVGADIALALAAHLALAWIGIALWGLHMGFTQGVLAAMVAKAAPAPLRGTAFGIFNLASGIAMLVSSALAGALWAWVGPAATFFTGAFFALACAAITKAAVR